MRASWLSPSSETRKPLSQYSPSVGVSRQPIRFMRVDLPEPDGPMMATNSFRRMVTSTPAEGVHDLAPHVVVALEVPGDDHGVPGDVRRQLRESFGGSFEFRAHSM